MIAPGAVLLGRYRVGPVVGQGGMAIVHEGDDIRTGRLVAIKRLAPQLAHDAGARRRFVDEARAARKLPHPHIVQVYDVLDVGAAGRDGDVAEPAIVFELVRGETLADRLARGPLCLDESLRIACQMADALGFAHSRGVIHRDVKPGNILLGDAAGGGGDGRRMAKLADFGIACAAGGASGQTDETQLFGSMPYVAPEVLSGRSGDARGDVYSLGVTLFRMLTGALPFGTELVAPAEALKARLTRDAPRVRTLRPDTPDWLDALVARALARDPFERFQDGNELHAALRRRLGQTDAAAITVAPSRRRLPAMVAAVAVVSALAIVALRADGRSAPARASAASTPAPTAVSTVAAVVAPTEAPTVEPSPTAIVVRPR